jgi:uncharacterized protein YndB with AHSA1/START domain
MSQSSFIVDKENLEVKSERIYNASAKRLFEAHTDPKQVAEWWGPNDYKIVVDTFDVKVGGAWRIVHTDQSGKEHAFRGTFKEIDEPNRIVRTFEYEPMAGHVLIETVSFEEQPDGRTKQTATAHYENLEDLNGMVQMGMEEGQIEGMERLAQLVEKQ